MAVDTSDFRNGMAIRLDGEIFQIVEFQHVKPGKGGAFVRTKLRKLKSGATLERTFRSGEKVEPVFVEKAKMQFLYSRGEEYVLMDLDSFEQVHVNVEELGRGAKFLKEEAEVLSISAGGEVLGYELPNFVELEVVETDPGFRGNTVSSGAQKPAKLETGASVTVPMHINIGDVVKIDTRTEEYLERVAKK